MARNIQSVDPENTLLIEAKEDTNLEEIYDLFIKGFKFRTVVIDDFLYLYKNKSNKVRKFINNLQKNNVEEIILFSTPDKLYDKHEDEKELKKKFLDSSEAEVIQRELYNGISKNERMIFTAKFKSEEFQTKVLGVLYQLKLPVFS